MIWICLSLRPKLLYNFLLASSIAVGLAKKILDWQASNTVWKILEFVTSTKDWVAKITDTFIFLSTFNHSRIFCENASLSRKTHASSKIIILGEPSKTSSKRWKIYNSVGAIIVFICISFSISKVWKSVKDRLSLLASKTLYEPFMVSCLNVSISVSSVSEDTKVLIVNWFFG